MELVEGLDQTTLDWEGTEGGDNGIGTLLYHIALVEMSWLYLHILEVEFPTEVKNNFPFVMCSSKNRLTRVLNVPLGEHLGGLARSRSYFLDAILHMTLGGWRRIRNPEDVEYEVTPEWALFHLVEHEAGQAFQISEMKRRAHRFLT